MEEAVPAAAAEMMADLCVNSSLRQVMHEMMAGIMKNTRLISLAFA